jgi:hypothetical protein
LGPVAGINCEFTVPRTAERSQRNIPQKIRLF